MIQTDLSADVVSPNSKQSEEILEFVRAGVDLEAPSQQPSEDPFWEKINGTKSELWLDSGDIDEIGSLWNRKFAGLTTNNTLLNREVQKGTYSDYIPKIADLVSSLDPADKVREIAFILNVRHALRLVEQFRCRVSVELHTDVAFDAEASLAFARRCHQVCPEFFVVKIPLTAAGLIAIKQLRSEGIAVNCTLGFSARENYVATALANPSYVNVFLGRLNSYVADNELGSGELVGERATLASQHEVNTFSRGLPTTETRQIAASLRDAKQLPYLAGVDVITMPTKVAKQAAEELDQTWQSSLNEDYSTSLHPDIDPDSVRLDKLWEVTKQERNLVQKLILHPPATAEKLVETAREHEVNDLFPQWSKEDREAIAEDGKVPQHRRWRDRIRSGEVAIDSLMTEAGLASFAASQAELDDQIRSTLT